MGNCCYHNKQIIKEGFLYESIKDQIRPFDVIFMKGNKIFSMVESILVSRGSKYPDSKEYTHVGMVITSDILDHPLMKKGELYIFESVISGKLDYGIYNIEGNGFSGVQIRNLRELVYGYDSPNETKVAFGKLTNNPIDVMPMEQVKQMFTEIYNTYNGCSYDLNPYSLLGSVVPCVRPMRHFVEEICRTEDWLFCSELVALVYKYFKIYPDHVNPRNVLPRDIAFPKSDTDQMPCILSELIKMTIPMHYSAK